MNNKLSLLVNFVGVDKMSGALRNIIGLGGKGSKSLRELAGEAKKLQREIADYDRKIQRASGNATQLLDEQKRKMEELEEVQRRLNRQQRIAAVEADRQAMRRRGSELKSSGAESVVAAGVSAIPLIAAAKQAMTFEAVMADVRKVVDFPTPRAFAQMSDDILALSTRIPMAAEGIAAIVAAGGRANIPRKELLRFAEDAAKMGVAFDITGDEAGAMMAKWRTAFTMGQSDVVRLSNQVNALTNAYGGNALSVSNIITRIGSLGKVSGVAAAQVASMAQLLNSVGVEEDVAATGIKNMMLAMTKGTAATKSQSAVLEKLGLNATSLAERMQKDAGGAITDLLARIARAPKAAQAGMLTDLFGSESVGAIAPLLTNLPKLQANFALVGNKAAYAGSMQKEYLSAIATTQGATGLAMNSLRALNIQLGQEFLPQITEGAKSVSSMAIAVARWMRAHPQLTSAIAQGAAALIAFRLGLGVTKFAIGSIISTYATFMTVAGQLKTGLGLLRTAFLFLGRGAMQAGMMMLTNPIVLAIAAIVVAIGVAAYLIYTHWDRIKAAFSAGVAGVKGFLTGLPAWFTNIGRMMMDGLLLALNPLAMARKLIQVAKFGIDAFKRYLGIKSPSRVFMALGGHVAGGLEAGIDRGSRGPARAAGRMASGVMAAGALSLLPFAAAALPAAPAGGGAPRGGDSYSISITQQPGEDADALADRVIEKIEKAKERKRRRGFGDE